MVKIMDEDDVVDDLEEELVDVVMGVVVDVVKGQQGRRKQWRTS
jgi:hypothetical protein